MVNFVFMVAALVPQNWAEYFIRIWTDLGLLAAQFHKNIKWVYSCSKIILFGWAYNVLLPFYF